MASGADTVSVANLGSLVMLAGIGLQFGMANAVFAHALRLNISITQ